MRSLPHRQLRNPPAYVECHARKFAAAQAAQKKQVGKGVGKGVFAAAQAAQKISTHLYALVPSFAAAQAAQKAKP